MRCAGSARGSWFQPMKADPRIPDHSPLRSRSLLAFASHPFLYSDGSIMPLAGLQCLSLLVAFNRWVSADNPSERAIPPFAGSLYPFLPADLLECTDCVLQKMTETVKFGS